MNTPNPPLSLRVLLPALALFFPLASSLSAQSILADRDTFVNKGSPDTNYGGSTTLQSRNDGGSAQSKTKDLFAYMSFNLSSLTTPVTDATLTLEFTAGSFDYAFEVYAIPDGGTDEFFDESTLTLNTAADAYTGPVNAGTEGSLERGGLELLGSFMAPPQYGPVSFTSTELVDFLNADTNDRVTFILYSTYQTGAAAGTFASREHGSLAGPTLDLNAIPEPAAASLLLGLGALAVTLSRRRRQ